MAAASSELVSHAMRVERLAERLLRQRTRGGERSFAQAGADLSRTLERVARDRVALASQRTAMDAARIAVEDEARRQSAFDRAFSAPRGTSDYVAVYGGSGRRVAGGNVGNGFDFAWRSLMFPLVGPSEVRPAKREGDGGPGLEMRDATRLTGTRCLSAGAWRSPIASAPTVAS